MKALKNIQNKKKLIMNLEQELNSVKSALP